MVMKPHTSRALAACIIGEMERGKRLLRVARTVIGRTARGKRKNKLSDRMSLGEDCDTEWLCTHIEAVN